MLTTLTIFQDNTSNLPPKMKWKKKEQVDLWSRFSILKTMSSLLLTRGIWLISKTQQCRVYYLYRGISSEKRGEPRENHPRGWLAQNGTLLVLASFEKKLMLILFILSILIILLVPLPHPPRETGRKSLFVCVAMMPLVKRQLHSM